MKFDMIKFIKKSALVSLVLGSSAFAFNNVYAKTSTSSSSKVTDSEAAVMKKMQSAVSTKYNDWLSSNKNASASEKNSKQEEFMTEVYNSLSDSDKKLVNSYLTKLSSKTSSQKKTTKTSKSATKSTKSAKIKTGDTSAIPMLGMSLLGSLPVCIAHRRRK